MDEESALDLGPVVGYFQIGQGRGIEADQFDPAEELHAHRFRVIHEEQRDAVVLRQIADAHVLRLPRKSAKPIVRSIENANKPGRTAAVLDVGPASSSRSPCRSCRVP